MHLKLDYLHKSVTTELLLNVATIPHQPSDEPSTESEFIIDIPELHMVVEATAITGRGLSWDCRKVTLRRRVTEEYTKDFTAVWKRCMNTKETPLCMEISHVCSK